MGKGFPTTFLRLQSAMDSNQGPRQEGKKYESGIPSTTSSETSGIKSIYICNDPTGAKVQERAEEHIQTSKSSNIITTSYYRVLEINQPIRFSRADHPRKVPRPGDEG
jgi:hypothetical protein